MSVALAASKLALPHCLPNPPVGCVLVKNDQVLATGYTREPGANHAEADALAQYAHSLEQVAAFVTLEPCSFFGRTPSCTKTLIARNINTVYIALADPDPRNSGAGCLLLTTYRSRHHRLRGVASRAGRCLPRTLSIQPTQ